MILLSSVFIYFAAENTIDSLMYLSEMIGISTAVISLTAVALGTSLPEAIVSVFAAKRGNYDMALGNIVGSNMFNVLLIPGTLGLFSSLIVSPETIAVGLPFLIIATFIFLFSLHNNKISKGEGMMFLLLYIFFTYSLYL
jgi:cation:H+ antiporter